MTNEKKEREREREREREGEGEDRRKRGSKYDGETSMDVIRNARETEKIGLIEPVLNYKSKMR